MSLSERYDKWVCKKFNIDRPAAATMDDWDEWHEKNKTENPRGYFFLETLPDFFGSKWHRITRTIKDSKYWIRYRTFDRYHVIQTGLKPGYRDFDERCLHGCFSLLVDYVETDLAWKSAVFSEEQYRKYPWWSKGLFRFKSTRMPTHGIDHLKWESGLDNPNLSLNNRSDHQAIRAREVLDLYHWWKYVRPLRKDPMDISGWSAFCQDKRNRGIKPLSDKGLTQEDHIRQRDTLDKMHEIEQAFEDEDTEQLVRLIKIRKGLWA